MTYGTNWQTTGQHLTSCTHLSIVTLWNETDIVTSFAFCTSQTRMNLTGRTKFWQTGRFETYLKFQTGHFQNFTTILNMWPSTKLLVCRKEGSFSDNTYHLFDLAILNSYILLSSCGGKKISHRDFRFTLVRNMLAQAVYERTIPRPLARHPSTASEISRLEASWPRPCAFACVCSTRVEYRKVLVKCRKCNLLICVERSCFEDYHTKARLWNFSFCPRWISLRKTGVRNRNVSKRNWIFWNFWKFPLYY